LELGQGVIAIGTRLAYSKHGFARNRIGLSRAITAKQPPPPAQEMRGLSPAAAAINPEIPAGRS